MQEGTTLVIPAGIKAGLLHLYTDRQGDSMSLPLCIDCRFYRFHSHEHHCDWKYPDFVGEQDLITGAWSEDYQRFCNFQREHDRTTTCGREAKHFQPKEAA